MNFQIAIEIQQRTKVFVRLAPILLRTDGRNFAEVDSTTDGCWRENYAGNHDG
jgi:hypothetical protein